MDLEAKAEWIRRANCISRMAARQGPILSLKSSVEEIAEWLQWCDPNGSHTSDLAIADDCNPYDDESIWEALAYLALED